MLTKDNAPELSAQYCKTMEVLRASIEIFSGERVQYENISFRRGRARVKIGVNSASVCFVRTGEDVHWCIEQCYETQRDYLTTLRVNVGLQVFFQLMCNSQVKVRGQNIDFYWYGQDYQNREIKFCYPELAANIARESAITIAQLQTEVTALVTYRQSMLWK